MKNFKFTIVFFISSLCFAHDIPQNPVIAILADNRGTETTDFIVPYGVFKESQAANVLAVSTASGRVKLMPALEIEADLTLTKFDEQYPSGADIVIIPALHKNKDKVIHQWVNEQAKKGAFLMSICEGAWVLGYAGELEKKKATTYWFAKNRMRKKFKNTQWVENQRYVFDGNVLTTTGISASIPASLALLEKFAGHEVAKTTAEKIGVGNWDSTHDSTLFKLSRSRVLTAMRNIFSFWSHETVELPLVEGDDEIAIALMSDAWSRTYKSKAIASHPNGYVTSKRGLKIYTTKPSGDFHRLSLNVAHPVDAIENSLLRIAKRYGKKTADFVSLLLEYRGKDTNE